MFGIIVLLLILYVIFVKHGKIKDFPMYPGALPIIGNLYILFGGGEQIFKAIKKISEKALENGGYVGLIFGPSTFYYVLADPEDCSAALNASLEKVYFYKFSRSWVGNGLITASPSIWKRNRKILHPMFSLQQVRTFLPVFNQQARRLIERFAEHENKGPFNPELHVSWTGLESICLTALGADVADHITKEYVEVFNSLSESFVTRFEKFWLHSDYIFNWSSLKKKQDEYVKYINGISMKLLKQRRTILKSDVINADTDKDYQPFVDTMIKAAAEHKEFTEEDIINEVNTIIAAGYDTSVNGSIICFLLIGHHQNVQEKVVEELKNVWSPDRDLSKDDLNQLVYLEAVIKEALRIYPVVPLVGRQTDVDLKLKNYTIPAGNGILVSYYALSRHPMWGPDVEQFRPERWLDGTAPTNPNLFSSFGIGKRNCIGKTYSMLAIKTMIAHVVRRFRISADVSKLVLKEDFIVKPASGHDITLEPRK